MLLFLLHKKKTIFEEKNIMEGETPPPRPPEKRCKISEPVEPVYAIFPQYLQFFWQKGSLR